MDVEAVILAGGLGTRLRSEVPDYPKPMAPIRDRPFLEIQLEYWIARGVKRFVISVGYKHELIREYFGSGFKGAEIAYACEEKPLGTGGGLLLALEQINNHKQILVLNGDSFLEVPWSVLQSFYRANRADMVLALFMAPTGSRYGRVNLTDKGLITGFEAGGDAKVRPSNGGIYLARPGALSGLGWCPGDRVSLEREMIPAMIDRGQSLFGLISWGRFIDIGLPEDYRAAQTWF